MKKTQLKDALRNIWKQLVSFLSIAAIAALGVTMFLGIDYSAAAINKAGSEFYDSVGFRDIEIVSTLLFSETDIEFLRGMDGVTDAEGVYLTEAKLPFGDMFRDASVISLTERLNKPTVIEGRLPGNETECAVEPKLAEELGLKTGDTVELTDLCGETAEYLSHSSFTITGIAVHPDHIAVAAPETPYIMVTAGAFDPEKTGGSFAKIELSVEKPVNAGRFGKAYTAAVSPVVESIEAIAPSRTAARDEETKALADALLSEKQALLDEAQKELDDARAELDAGYAELEVSERDCAEAEERLKEARQALDEALAELESSAEELEAAREKLDSARAELEKNRQELDSAKKELNAAKKELESGWDKLEKQKASMRRAIRSGIEDILGFDTDGSIAWAGKKSVDVNDKNATAMELWITDTYKFDLHKSLETNVRGFVYSDKIPEYVLEEAYYALGGEGEYDPDTARALLADEAVAESKPLEPDYKKLVKACKKWDAGHDEYIKGRRKYNAALKEYNAAYAEYEAGEAEYEAGLAERETGLAEYRAGEEEYLNGSAELEAARAEMDLAAEKLREGEEEYAEGMARLEEGRAELDSTAQRLGGVAPCKWIVLDADGNSSFVQLGNSGSNLKSLEMTFAMLFVLVGALVIYATISKMIDEQRTLVGTTKALGFYSGEVFMKYLLFGVTATLMGLAIGFLLARFFVENLILNGYGIYYHFDINKPTTVLLPTLIVLAAGTLLAVTAIWLACSRLLKTSAVKLMAPAAPEGRKKSSVRKHVLSLYSRLILLNIRTDIKRVIVTVASVAGCCALIVIGITLKLAVQNSVKLQYSRIIKYDGLVKFDPDAAEGVSDKLGTALTETGADFCPVSFGSLTVNIGNIEVEELYCGDMADMSEMFRLLDAKTGEPLDLSGEGIYVPKRFSESYHVKVGDSFDIALGGAEAATVKVAGVFNNYMNRAMFMSGAYFSEVFGRESVPDAYMVRLNGQDETALIRKLSAVKGFDCWSPSDSIKTLFESATSVMNLMVALFIVMAAIMAGVVLLNLTNIYVMQKKREMTIMRVNGFTVGEVIGYVIRETVVTTIVGIVIGAAAGSLLAYNMIRLLEQPFFQYDRRLCLTAWAIGAAITVLFTLIVNVIALRRVRRLNLTDVN